MVRPNFLNPPMGSFMLASFGNSKDDMERDGMVCFHPGSPRSPCFSRVAEDFEKCLILVFVSGKDLLGISNDEDITFCRKPLQVGQAFFQRVPIVTEVVGKIQNPFELGEQRGGRAAFGSAKHFRAEPLRDFHEGLDMLT